MEQSSRKPFRADLHDADSKCRISAQSNQQTGKRRGLQRIHGLRKSIWSLLESPELIVTLDTGEGFTKRIDFLRRLTFWNAL